ncbi:MAG: hypothetical protein R3F56_07170 [Planctomycetota bacterium]
MKSPHRAWFGLCLLATLPAQTSQDERVELRVLSSSGVGTVAVDRGQADGLAVGDAVVLRPRAGGEYRGTIIRVDERTATVELLDRDVEPPAGTRGEALVPAGRRPRATRPAAEPVAPPPDRPTTTPERQPPQWQNRDEAWSADKPLLAQVRPVHPRDRRAQYGGRFFAYADLNHSNVEDLDNTILRTGSEAWLDNPFGRGGSLRFDGDFNYKTETDGATGLDLTVRELSYHEGGTRFEPTRWQVGRFLQADVPQLGLLDGVAWSHRRENGHRFGASLGFLPELDDDMQTGEDLQLAAFYRWVNDESETLSVTAAAQKTFHRGRSDRDLVLLDVRRLPVDGWDLRGSLWIDLYSGRDRDAGKGPGPEITHAFASAGRRFAGGGGLDLSYRRLRFPAQLRNAHAPVTAAEIGRDVYDRLALTGWTWPTEHQRAHGVLSGFVDEDTDGAALELGLDTMEVLLERGHLDVTVWGNAGRFGSSLGGRVTLGRTTDDGSWDVMYELANHHFDGFSANRDDLLQHRLYATRTFELGSGWHATAHAGAHFWDSDRAWSLGAYLQRSF